MESYRDFSDPSAPNYSYWAATQPVTNDWYRFDEIEPFVEDPKLLIERAKRRLLTGWRVDHGPTSEPVPEFALMLAVESRERQAERRRERARELLEPKPQNKPKLAVDTAVLVFVAIDDRVTTPSEGVHWHRLGEKYLLDDSLYRLERINVPYCPYCPVV